MRSWLVALALLSACGKNEKPPPPANVHIGQESGPSGGKPGSPTSKQAEQAAQAMFSQVCAMCHGMDGTGRGPAAEALNPKPRNYTDAAWQASVTDDDIKKIILLGGQGVGKSPSMPPNPNLKEAPEVLDALVKHIRSFGKK
jgi:cytochrome c553